jgi:sugar lactone lactonase YvrE
VVEGGPKLVRFDLSTNQMVKVIRFDESVAPPSSYLNDVRISPDGRHAYMTDSGRAGLVVVDLESGTARRVLDGHPSTRAEKDVVVKTDGNELRRPDGRGAEFNADGIAVSPDGQHLYWQALTGKTMYRIETAALRNTALTPEQLAARIEKLGTGVVSDGYWMEQSGRLYLSALEDDAIMAREPDGRIVTILKDKRLRWPDSFAQIGGTILITSSRIQDSAWFKPETGPRLQTSLWRFTPSG